MPLRGIVFDFDGVIADTEPAHLAAFQDVLATPALSLSTAAYYDRYLGYDDAGRCGPSAAIRAGRSTTTTYGG